MDFGSTAKRVTVQNSGQFGSLTVSTRPNWAGLTPFDTGNFNPATKADLSSAAPTGMFSFGSDIASSFASRLGSGGFLQVIAKTTASDDAAGMMFHKPGNYAVWFGLDYDHQFSFGGWSEGARRFVFWTQKNLPKPTQKFVGTITGNGSSTSFSVTHGLNTQDLIVGVTDAAGNTVLVDAPPQGANSVLVLFNTPPVSGAVYKVIIIG